MNFIQGVGNSILGKARQIIQKGMKQMELVNAMAIKTGDQGGDMSHYQAVNNWNLVAGKLKFLYLKSTEGSEGGSHYVDPKMDTYFHGAKSVGIPTGFYHFCRFVSVADAIEEAKWFIKNIQKYNFDLPPCLDLEYNGCGSTQVLKEATVAFLKYVEQQLGSAVIYLDKEFYDMVKDAIGNYGIWLANPATSINIEKTLAQLFAWQTNWHGSVAGVSGEVDLDIAGGSFFTTHNKMLAPAPAPTVPPKVEPTPAPVQSAPVTPAPAPKPVDPTAPYVPVTNGVIAKVRVIADQLNIRVAPNSGAAIVRVAQKGEVFDVYANVNDWHNVGGAAWVFGNNGQYLELVVPAPAPTYVNYTVKAGDTLSGIAAAHGTTTAVLQSLNNIADASMIMLGQVIKLPSSGAAAAAPKVIPASYVVQPGDTLSGVAVKTGVSQRVLEKLNHITEPNKIFAGQHLRLR